MTDRIPNWQRQAWLTEYQVCQQDSSDMIRTHWTVVGIFLGANTAILGYVASKYIVSTIPVIFRWPVPVSVFGVAIILIFIMLFKWLNRVNFLVNVNNHRMCEIETKLGMRKNRILDILDNKDWDTAVSASEKLGLKKLHEKLGKPCWKFWSYVPHSGDIVVKHLYFIFILLWLGVIAIAWMLDP